MNWKRSPRSLFGPATLACLVTLLFCTIQSLAQETVQVLRNHVPSAVSTGKAALAGSLSPTQKLHVTITLPLRNQDALTSLLQRLYDPRSSDYRKFLTVAQFTERFAPTAEDYEKVVGYVKSYGLTVTEEEPDRLIVPIDGTVQQIQSAFNVQMNTYRHPTENRTFYAPDRDPSLTLSTSVTHITGLDNFRLPRPTFVRKDAVRSSQRVAATGSGPSGNYLASDMRAAYAGGTALTGSGQTVAMVEFDGYNLSDVNLSFSSVGQSYSVPVQNVLVNGATGASCQFLSPCSDTEQVLDIVQAIGMAPGLSQVRVYIGTTDTDIFHKIYQENIASVVSISWVWGDNTSGDDPIFEAMRLSGQTIFAASGDWGSYPAIYPAFPAEDTYVTAVGGTHLTTSGAGGSWVSETAWSDSGGGPSPDGIPIPSWQSGLNGVNGASTLLRNAPDVAAEGDFDNYYCNLGSCGGGEAGTSYATPRWAGFMALVNQQAVISGTATNGRVGFIDPTLYSIGEGANYSSDFHDITSGSNGGYSSGAGYDLVTGWGSPNGQNLIYALAGSSTPPQTGTITTVAGNGTAGYSGDGSAATGAELYYPSAIAVDSGGNLYIADTYNNCIRSVTATSGVIQDWDATQNGGYTVCDATGPAQFLQDVGGDEQPAGVAVDSSGNVSWSMTYANAVVTPFGTAGSGAVDSWGYGGNGLQVPNSLIQLELPQNLAVDSAGNLYIADSYNSAIRKISASTHIITTIAGQGNTSACDVMSACNGHGFSGDGGAATSAYLAFPWGVAADNSGNVYIADTYNNRIRKITASTGVITTIAGTGTAGYSGDGGAPTSAKLNLPEDVAVDQSGNIYIADQGNNRIRKISASTGLISTVAGTGMAGFSGDGGSAASAALNAPQSIALDQAGNLYIADSNNNRIRKVTF
jgi:sugar lactone lactonase YvrE